MRYHIKLQSGDRAAEHRLDLRSALDGSGRGGKVEFQFDSASSLPQSADCAETAPGVYSIILDGRSYEARLERAEANSGPASHPPVNVRIGDRVYQVEIHDPRKWRPTAAAAGQEGSREIRAPMPGRIVKILVEDGQQVAAGAGLVIIEAMKMQNEMRAPAAGRVAEVYVEEGSGVESGERLVRLV